MFNVKTATTAELIAKYNELTGKATKRFASRADGEKAVQRQLDSQAGIDKMNARARELRDAGAVANSEAKAKAKPVAALSIPLAIDDLAKGKAPWPSTAPAPAAKPASKRAAKARIDPMLQPLDRSAAIARSWGNTAVADARRERTHVTVNGQTFKSTAEAFRQLRLPMGGHIKFRMELKREGKKVFTTPEGKQFNFVVVK